MKNMSTLLLLMVKSQGKVEITLRKIKILTWHMKRYRMQEKLDSAEKLSLPLVEEKS
jgi:hypothetical protein